jgi:MinD-like ATPase involved in chromosome partitioning or flagellar assembly
VLVAGGATLAWGRLAGRPLLEWSVLLVRFLVRTRHQRTARLRAGWIRWGRPGAAARSEKWRRRLVSRAPRSGRALQTGAVVIPLALRRVEAEAGSAVGGETEAAWRADHDGHCRSHVVCFFSLNGGTGRTTLAVEVAAMPAVGGRATAATRWPGVRVALLDLTERSPGVGLRLGIPPPPARGDAPPTLSACLVATGTRLLVGLAPAAPTPAEPTSAVAPEAVIEAAEDRGADVVVVDVDCDLSGRCRRVLQRCDQVLVTVTPTAGGVLDAYRSTAVLRRMGLRDRIAYVVNRWRPGIDLAETMADLGGVIAAEIPDDPAVVDAENRHRIAGLDSSGALAEAFTQLASVVETASGLGRWSVAERRVDSHSG